MFLKKVTIDQNRFPTRAAYPFSLPVFQHTASLEFPEAITVFTGENGTGKSTLLTALCRKCNIHIWEGAYRQRYQPNPYEKLMDRALDIEWRNGSVPGSFFSPEFFRHFSQLVDEWAAADPGQLEYFGGKSLMTLSHGQSCLAYFKSRFKVRGIHFLDEPEAALSPASQVELAQVLTEMSATGEVQFVISTHSPILMSCAATIYNFGSQGIERVAYQDTMHYRIYKEFFSRN